MERFLSKYRVPVVAMTMALFAVAYGVESIGNHLLYRTYGLDLGIYAQTARDFGHLHLNDGSMYQWEPSNQLADHFDLLLALLGPLTWVVRADWLLLVVQLAAVLAGAWGLYRLTRDMTGAEAPSLLAMLLMLVQYGVWHALGYDYHSNVLAACMLPWLILCLRRPRLGAATAVLILMAMTKETVALWLCFVLPALLWEHRSDRRVRRWLLAATAAMAAYFVVVTMVVMPSLGNGNGKGFLRYSWMGATMGEVAQWIATHPLEALRDVFVDFTHDGKGVLKTEFLVCTLTSGLLLALFKPSYLLMLIPPVAMKMLSNDTESFWGIAYHYNIEVCVVVCCAAAATLAKMQRRGWQTAVAAAALVMALATTVYTTHHPQTHIRRANVDIFCADHYRQRDFDVATARKALAMIPADASVCAATPFVPHLASRDNAYIYPIGLGYNAEYYLIFNSHWSYYEGEEETAARLIGDTASYRTLLTDSTIYLLQRIE